MPHESITDQDIVCHAYNMYDNAFSMILTNVAIMDLGKGSIAESDYLWISFEPVNDPQAAYLYLGFSFDFLQEMGLAADDTLNPLSQVLSLAELIKNNNFVISHLRLEYYNYLEEIKNTRFKKIYSLKWLSKVTYSLIHYLNEITILDEEENNVSKSDKMNIFRLEAELSEKLNLTPEVKDMADSLNMSVGKFKIAFKSIYNETPHQYFLKKRLERAVELLQAKDYSFSEISYRLGFSHPSGLTRLFKSKMGATPTSLLELQE